MIDHSCNSHAEQTPDSSKISFAISAPGKVILHGEHSVVYGKLAIAASLGLRTKLRLTESVETGEVTLNFSNLKWKSSFDVKDLRSAAFANSVSVKTTADIPSQLEHEKIVSNIEKYLDKLTNLKGCTSQQRQSTVCFLYLYQVILGQEAGEVVPFEVNISTELSIGAGTGSSASFSVCLAAALIHYRKLKTNEVGDDFTQDDRELISQLALEAEKIIHGTPSGLDNTICTYGSLVEFRRNSSPKLLSMTHDFKAMLVDTQISRNTKQLVSKMAEFRDRHPFVVDGIFDTMDRLAASASEVFRTMNEKGDVENHFQRLEELFTINHGLLNCLGVGHPSLDEICRVLKKFGLHGKLTGAGGGGYAICLLPVDFPEEKSEEVMDELRKCGFNAVVTKLGGPGVCLDK